MQSEDDQVPEQSGINLETPAVKTGNGQYEGTREHSGMEKAFSMKESVPVRNTPADENQVPVPEWE